MILTPARMNEIEGRLAGFMRSENRLKDFRNYYQAALRMGLTVAELDDFMTQRAQYVRRREAGRKAWRAEFEAKMERCPQHADKPALLRIVPDPDGGGIVLACPVCRWSRYLADTTPQEYMESLGISPPQRR